MSVSVGWPGIARGAGLALAVAVPVIVLAEVVDAAVDIDPDSDLVFLFYVAVVAGLVVGGWLAATSSPEAPLTHGALAAIAAYVVLVVALAVVRLASGDAVDPVAVVFNGLMAASAGILGGLVAGRRPRGHPPREE